MLSLQYYNCTSLIANMLSLQSITHIASMSSAQPFNCSSLILRAFYCCGLNCKNLSFYKPARLKCGFNMLVASSCSIKIAGLFQFCIICWGRGVRWDLFTLTVTVTLRLLWLSPYNIHCVTHHSCGLLPFMSHSDWQVVITV